MQVLLILAAAASLTAPESVPEWARTGVYRAARWDGGPIEAEKGRLSGWPNFTEADQRGVMAATRDWYNLRTIEFLKRARINWAWITWSVGFSQRTEKAQWELAQRYIAACHANGIRVAAYLSIANMFWRDMFEYEPTSKNWVEQLADGSPRFYKPPHRYMARISEPAWREYVKERVRAALEAGADSFWVDNTFAYHGAENAARLLSEIYHEAGRKIVLMSNYNRSLYTWARFQNGVTTEDGQEPGYYPEDPEPKRLVTNAGLLRYQRGISEGWRPVSVEYGGRHRGERFTTPMEPHKWQLSLAECAAFQASLEPFFEGLFLRDLYYGEPAALEKLAAIGRYNAFFEKNEQYYAQVRSAARVAVLSDGNDTIVPALNDMARRNVQFDVCFDYQKPSLNSYQVVLSPKDLPATPQVEDLVRVEAPPTVLYSVVRQDKPRRLIVHLLNYKQDRVTGIRVRVQPEVREVRVLSPDIDRPVMLPPGSLEVPELDTYDLVVIDLK